MLSTKLSTLGASLTRTVVPLIVGWLVALGLLDWTGLDAAGLTGLVTAAVAAAYYAVARVLELYVRPRFGWLLGLAKAPVAYVKDTTAPVVVNTTLSYPDGYTDTNLIPPAV